MHWNSVQYVQYAHIPVSKMNIVVIYPFRRALKKKGQIRFDITFKLQILFDFCLNNLLFPRVY